MQLTASTLLTYNQDQTTCTSTWPSFSDTQADSFTVCRPSRSRCRFTNLICSEKSIEFCITLLQYHNTLSEVNGHYRNKTLRNILL